MPQLDQFLIAPIQEGQRKDVAPWLIPDEAFQELKNAYVWRSRIRKRFGSRFLPSTSAVAGAEQLNSRLRIQVDTTGAGGNASGTVPNGATDANIGQMFSIGDEMFTVYQATGTMYITGSTTTATFDTTTGGFVFAGAAGGAAGTAVYWYPSLPVMGLLNYEKPEVNDEESIAFDTRFAYRYIASGWTRIGTGSGSPNTWTGTDSQFFWAENWKGNATTDRLLFATNNSATDKVRYWNGSAWAVLNPNYDTAGGKIDGCRIIIAFKDRLLFLNTWETPNGGALGNYQNRVRYSQNGTPLVTVDTTSWHEGTSTPGKGGFIDAPTKEAIITAKILRDRLIVFFERSTWELVYTGNRITPFVFQKIDSELGAESTFSSVLFDKVLLGVGNVGIHACNGATVERIDQKIPQTVFKIHNGNQGVERVAGIREYVDEVVFWTLPDETGDPTYPTRVLVYNYKNRTWAINDDCITAFGYYQNTADLTWAEVNWTWAEWQEPWSSGDLQSKHRWVIAGNQQGYTFKIDSDIPRNAPALQITNLANAAGVITVTCYSHNLEESDYILIEDVQGATGLDGIYEIQSVPTADTFTINEPSYASTYTGGGTIARVSKIEINTKEYNFYQKQGDDLFIPKVGFYVDRQPDWPATSTATDPAAQLTVEYRTSSSSFDLFDEAEKSGSALGTAVLETTPYTLKPYESSQKRFWHAIYPQAEGEVIQLRLFLDIDTLQQKYLDEDLTMDEFVQVCLADFRLNAMSFYSRAVRRY